MTLREQVISKLSTNFGILNRLWYQIDHLLKCESIYVIKTKGISDSMPDLQWHTCNENNKDRNNGGNEILTFNQRFIFLEKIHVGSATPPNRQHSF